MPPSVKSRPPDTSGSSPASLGISCKYMHIQLYMYSIGSQFSSAYIYIYIYPSIMFLLLRRLHWHPLDTVMEFLPQVEEGCWFAMVRIAISSLKPGRGSTTPSGSNDSTWRNSMKVKDVLVLASPTGGDYYIVLSWCLPVCQWCCFGSGNTVKYMKYR